MEEVLDEPYAGAFPGAPEEEEIDIPLEGSTNALLHLGYLSRTVKIGMHTVILHTLKIGEEFEAAMLAKKYEETIEAGRALATALIAASISTVDGKPLVEDILGPEDYSVESQFVYICNNWYWPPIKMLYDEYQDMVRESREAYENLKKV